MNNWGYILLSLLPALLNVGIIFYVLFYLPKSRLTDIFSGVVFALILWQFEDTIFRCTDSKDTARFADKLLCIGWLGIAPLTFHFACRLARIEELTSRIALFFLYAPFVIFYLLYISNTGTTILISDDAWGWLIIPRQGTYDEFQRYWMALTIMATVFILFRHAFSAGTNTTKKYQAWIIAFGVLFPALQGIITQLIFPVLLHIKELPLTSTFMSVFSLATIIGMTRFKLFEVSDCISECIQADFLMGNLTKIIVIVSPGRKIIYANQYASEALGINPDDLESTRFADIFFPGEKHYESYIQEVFQKVVEGGTVHNYPCSLQHFENKKICVLVTSTVIMNNNIVQGVMFVANDITEVVAAVKQLEQEKVAKEQAITYAVLCAQEKERKMLGTELHDNINQILTGSLLYLKMVKKGTTNQSSYLEEMNVLIQQAMYEIRKLSHSLVTPSLDEVDLSEALDNIITIVGRTETLAIKKTLKNVDEINLPEQLKLNIYRIVQEQLNNIIKYASATKVWIKLVQKGSQLQLCIKDDGIGFDTSQKLSGVGLTNIKTRASVYNGKLKILSSPGKGCILNVTFENLVGNIIEPKKKPILRYT